MSESWWTAAVGAKLAQGDLLPRCLVPDFVTVTEDSTNEIAEIPFKQARLIVITQSCDLENDKIDFVALCQVLSLTELGAKNPNYRKHDVWESVRKGRVEALHLLASPDHPDDNLSCLVVDFGHIVSLPISYLSQHAASLGDRWRLQPPFLEHFSQAFARFFMRVGLPSSISPFR